MAGTSNTTSTLSSIWDGLSSHLIASIYQVRRTDGGMWEKSPDSPVVKAPLTEASLQVLLNWQSPFEQAGPEARAPMLMALLQSGALKPLVDLVQDKGSEGHRKANEFLQQFEGRTGITKLNSTQVFNGMPPVKITTSAIFRAWSNPTVEVEAPFDQLMQWALPTELSADGSVLARAVDAIKGETGYVDALMPSRTPVHVAMNYKNRRYSPLVIESIDMPMDAPVDAHGRYIQMVVPMTLCTLTAIDRTDWSAAKLL